MEEQTIVLLLKQYNTHAEWQLGYGLTPLFNEGMFGDALQKVMEYFEDKGYSPTWQDACKTLELIEENYIM